MTESQFCHQMSSQNVSHSRWKSGRLTASTGSPEIAYVCAITWAHFVRTDHGKPVHPIILVEGPASSANATANAQLHYIVKAWSEYSGATLFQNDLTTRARQEGLEDYRIALPDDQK